MMDSYHFHFWRTFSSCLGERGAFHKLPLATVRSATSRTCYHGNKYSLAHIHLMHDTYWW